jgi:DNA-binding PadR family transcriptional regulator
LEFDIMADDPVTRHFFNGFIRLHILYHAAKQPVYGAEITEELIRHGYRLSQGTLYPALHLLEELGYLRSHTTVVQGKRRKYYAGTAAGRKVLLEARHKLVELVAEVIEGHDKMAANGPPKTVRRVKSPAANRRRQGVSR